jgi:glycosyltransferase involved in cell wall biosynthesis
MGKAILESYAQGRAVVATDLGSRPELVVEGKTGLLYLPGNREQLAAAISALYEQPRLAAEMGAAGRELVKRQHSPERYYDSLMNSYTQLARSKPRTVVGEQMAGKRLRIAFIGGRGVIGKYSGIEAYYEGAGRHLVEMGHAVTVYCRSYFTPPAATHEGMRLVRLPTIRTKHLETLVHTLLSTAHAMFSNYDLVHYHTLGPGLFSFLPRLAGKKTIVTVHGLDWQRRKWGRVASTVLRVGEWAAVRFPNATMVVSRTLQDHYRTRHHAETAYAPSGTELRERCSAQHLQQWRLEPDQYILFLGRFSPEKNCELLIRAYERIDTTVKLVLAGGSSYSDKYVKELRQHQNERVLVLDWVSGDALKELLTNAMIFVLPSDLEGLSLALLDAMASGLCVLTSDVPENREVVEGAGFTFRRRDEEDLARMLRQLIGDKELRERAGRAARERARERYLWRHVAEEIEREYFKVMRWPPTVHNQPMRTQPEDRAA